MVPSTPPSSASHDASASVLESTLEDVLAFIDDLDAELVSSSAATPAASSAVDSDDDPLLHIQSAELLSFIDATMSSNASFFLDPLQPPLESSSADMKTEVAETSAASDSVAAGAEAEESKEAAGSVRTAATRKRNTYRDKMKHELQYLRLRTVELEEKLIALKQGTTLVSPEDKALLDSAWKRIAANQKEYRKQSEAENERLKREVHQQIEMAGQMQQTLGKRLTNGEILGNCVKKGRKSTTTLDEEEEFAALTRDLAAAFSRMDAVFQENEIAKRDAGRARSATMKMGVSETSGEPFPYTELIDVIFTPFDCRMASRAVWLSALQIFVHRPRPGLERVWHTKNAFAVKFEDVMPLENSGVVTFRTKLVVQKFFESDDRMVIVWRSITAPEDDPSGIFADETGWASVEPVSTSAGYVNHSGCSIIRTCVHMVRRHKDSALVIDAEKQNDPSVEQITDLFITSSEVDMSGLMKTFESILLDEVNAASGSSES
uniref:START domain-containing protein n=1 Tax=Globisporangium ultimum (strain ATCC 200006 / CBS 805.95 / DAOM BR144) TaxID=431595 RepID=K3W9G1_GLOUD